MASFGRNPVPPHHESTDCLWEDHYASQSHQGATHNPKNGARMNSLVRRKQALGKGQIGG
jgi:hypothetical protein